METFEQVKMSFPLPYPYKESKLPIKSRLTLYDIPGFIQSMEMKEEVYPDVKSPQAIYIAGTNIEKWNDFYCDIYIYCCEFRISNLFIIWNLDSYIRVIITDPNWQNYLGPPPSNFVDILATEYNVGTCIPLIDKSPRKTLLSFPSPRVFQFYASAAVGKTSSSAAKSIPPINFDNLSAFDVIKSLGQTVFFHSSCGINIARFNEVTYIRDLLIYGTAHGVKGVVFHCGSTVNDNLQQCINKSIENIVTGIRAAIFSSTQTGTAKFLLETPAGDGTKMFSTFAEFNNFCYHIKTSYPDIAPFFGICVDTCHVFDISVSPDKYLREILKFHQVDLVHFNDSQFGWGAHKDRHGEPGAGHIPWVYLLNVAKICKANNIPALFEF
jgi:endonuclease IV